MLKPDEIYFWNLIKKELTSLNKKTVRDVINEKDFPIHYKRAWYLLEKWSQKDWYDYGVSLDLGWITPEGLDIHLKSKMEEGI